ncbi:NACHT N-terminal helical domain 7-containing protein [Herbidospora cretacea]|uniref:NACHT N-terminal helical domain 7-containing protein n=1 Tax=Herbidospora cretacea TaxID=28444 RepID=UPI0007749C48|nr:hypothetical protein [Herbidospora cretacea]
MAKPVSYTDAVDLLSGESRTIRALDTALGWGLLFGGPITWSLIDAKNEAIRLLHQAVGSLREKVVVAPRATRTELLVAAHEVIMTTAFFEALDDVELPFRVEDMRIQGPDLRRFLNEVTGLRTCLLTRRPMTPTSLDLHELRLNYQIAASNLSGLVHALPLAKVLYSEQWEAVTTALHGQLHEAAVRRYQDLYHRLASEFPEFAFWAQMRAHESTQAGLVGLEKMLMEVTAGRIPSAQMARLHALNAAALTRPISQSEDQVGDLRMPSLGEGYVVPLFRQMTDPTHHDLSSESSWEAQTSRGDLGQVLAAHLTSPEARQAPMLILGQPGAGKSVLTKMLAARLPQGDFLPIRVPLRQVPAMRASRCRSRQASMRRREKRSRGPTCPGRRTARCR